MLGSNLLRYNNDQKYLIIDTETPHLNLCVDNPPFQCSWLTATKDKILDIQNHYLNWNLIEKYKGRFNISKGSRIITNYNDELVRREGRHPREIYDQLRLILKDKNYKIIIHNGLNFDTYIEKQWCYYLGEIHDWSYLDRLIDTNCIEKAIVKKIAPDLNNFLEWQYKLCHLVEKKLKSSISHCLKKYKIIIDENSLHNAGVDVLANYEIFKQQIWQIEI